MKRKDHQPVAGPVKRAAVSTQRMKAACGNSAALILAHITDTTPLTVTFEDPEQKPVTCAPAKGEPAVARPLQTYNDRPLVAYAIETCARAQVKRIAVLTAPEIADDVRAAVSVETKRLAQAGVKVGEVEFVMYDRTTDVEMTRQAANFYLNDLSFYILDLGRKLVNRAKAESLFVVSADQVRVTEHHLFEIAQDLQDHPDAEGVLSWIMWYSRTPYLLTRTFLRSLAASDRCKPREGASSRPLAMLNLRSHVFGEEMIAANRAQDARVATFTDKAALSALEAVKIARLPKKKRKAHLSKASKADKLLVECAVDVIDRMNAALSADEARAIKKADAIGKRCKKDFPIFNAKEHKGTLCFLDSAATAQRAGCAIEASKHFDEHQNANIYRGQYQLSAQSTALYNDARAEIEQFIGADRRDTVFTMNTTTATNLIAENWGEWNIRRGDVIAVPISEHHSDLLPWMMLAMRKKAELAYIDILPDGRIDLESYKRVLARKPKLVCAAQIGNVLGIENPVADMAKAAHEVGARFLVDAAQSLPHIKIDVKALGCDFLVFSGHKAYGPMGIGGVWISPDAFAEMDPLGAGGGTVSHVSADSYYLRAKAVQYEFGTPAVSEAIGLASALHYLNDLGMDTVERHARALTGYLVKGLEANTDVTVWGDHSQADGLTGLVSFTVRSADPVELAQFLGARGVCIRSGGHCATPLHTLMGLQGTGRASLGIYNTQADVEALLACVEALTRLKG